MKKQHTIEVRKDFCIGCGLCKEDCPVNNININTEGLFKERLLRRAIYRY